MAGMDHQAITDLAVAVTPPTPQNIGEYLILLVLTGGGTVAFKQLTDAYKSWRTARRSEAKRVELDRENVVERIVHMLQEQLDEQSEDFTSRLADKDRYYSEELQRRSRITDENLLRRSQVIDELQRDNKRLRRLLGRYQSEYGYLYKENGEREMNTESEDPL